MKNLFFTLAILFANIAISQTHQITKHNGEQLDVNFIKNENGLIYYSFNGSSEENKISKYAVSKITNKQTNQTQKITDRVAVVSQSDYKKVTVLDQEKTTGLKVAANFSGVSTKTKGEPPIANQNNTELRIKTKSALSGYPFVSIVQKDNGKYEAVAYVY
jgi:isocitrate/isopropylmalate dehydrogenase